MKGSCECGNEPSGSINRGKFLDSLSYRYKDSEEDFRSMKFTSYSSNTENAYILTCENITYKHKG